MAKMFPSYPDPDSPPGERKVFEIFASDLPADLMVFHGRRVVLPASSEGPFFQGEGDFIVFDPKRGYVVLEVKGGRVGRSPDGWYSIDRHGQRHSIKDPGTQAQTIAHRLRVLLSKQRAFSGRGGTPPFGFGAVFPDVDVKGDLDPALPREIVIDRGDLSRAAAAVRRAFEARGMDPIELQPGAAAAFREAVAPTLDLVPSLAARIQDEAKELVRLTEEQMEVLDGLDEWNRASIQGVAGSGKTMLAMEKASRMSREGKRVLLLCYNQPLANHLARQTQDFTIKTFHSLCLDMARGAGLGKKIPAASDRESTFFEEDAPELLMQAAQRLPDERFDAIVVDEGQDFRELWWPAVEALLRDSRNSTLYVFWDPNQDLYGGGPSKALGLRTYTLMYNCRNTKRIARYAGSFLNLEPKVRAGAPEGEEVLEFEVSGSRAMVDTVRKLLHRFVTEESVPTDRIVVLSAGSAENSPVWRERRLGNVELIGLESVPGPREVRFASHYRFKGLEADVIVLCDVKPGTKPAGPHEMHVGTSRACHVLTVIRQSV